MGKESKKSSKKKKKRKAAESDLSDAEEAPPPPDEDEVEEVASKSKAKKAKKEAPPAAQSDDTPSVSDVCDNFGLNDVELDYTEADYQNLTTYKLFQQTYQSKIHDVVGCQVARISSLCCRS